MAPTAQTLRQGEASLHTVDKGWQNFARTPLTKDFDSAMYCIPSASTYWHHPKQGHEGISLYHTAEASHPTQA